MRFLCFYLYSSIITVVKDAHGYQYQNELNAQGY